MTAAYCICGAQLVPKVTWYRLPHDQRDPGRRPHHSRGLCAPCYTYLERRGALADHPRITRAREDTLDDWVWLRDSGAPLDVAAQRMGMTVSALDRALHRALRRGDERGRHDGSCYHATRQTRQQVVR